MTKEKNTKDLVIEGTIGLTLQKFIPDTQVEKKGLTGMPLQPVIPLPPTGTPKKVQQGQSNTNSDANKIQ